MGYSFLGTIVSRGSELMAFLGEYGVLICTVLPVMLFAPGLLISKLRESHKLRKHEVDHSSLKQALSSELGDSAWNFTAVAVKRVMVRRNKDAECNYHRSLALAVTPDKIVVFIMWKRMGEINLKKLHTQMIRDTGYVVRGKSLQLFFAIPDFSGQLVVCAKPKFFYSETASDWDAIGMNQADELETLTNALNSQAKQYPWSKWKPIKKTGSLFLRLIGLYVCIFPALMLFGMREETLAQFREVKRVTASDVRDAKLREGQYIRITQEEITDLFYVKEPEKVYQFTKGHGIETYETLRTYWYVVEIADEEGSCFMAYETANEITGDSAARRNSTIECRVSKLNIAGTKILSSFLLKNNKIDKDYYADPSISYYKVVAQKKEGVDGFLIFLLVWLAVGVAIIIASFSDHVRRT